MAIIQSYMKSVKNLSSILSAIINAQAPDKFTHKYLSDLGFPSSNDRSVLPLLKGLGFLDDANAPTQVYFDYLDEDNAPFVLAQAIREAYSDLFQVNNKAYEMSPTDVKKKLKSLLQGKKGDAVLIKMATTFTTLSELADFSKSIHQVRRESQEKPTVRKAKSQTASIAVEPRTQPSNEALGGIDLRYNIHIQLPATRDRLVYDAIFKSIRENLT